MNKGKLIGKGMTAEVYEWGNDKVLKLYLKRFSEDWIKYEARIGKAVHDAGVPSPAVFDIVEIDERKGIIFQRIYGKSMLNVLQTEPWNIFYFVKQLAQLQYNIHQHSTVDLPNQKEKYTARIKSLSKILGSREQKILDYLMTLPGGESVCHGDLHFCNIMISKGNLIPIDWTNAYQGDSMGDVARTCLMITSPAMPPGTPGIFAMMSQQIKWMTHQAYLSEYMKLSGAASEGIDAWILPTAAAKLWDKVPGEKNWLMDIIDGRLNQLG